MEKKRWRETDTVSAESDTVSDKEESLAETESDIIWMKTGTVPGNIDMIKTAVDLKNRKRGEDGR